MNRWNIPPALEEQVRTRDKSCVYCRVAFTSQERRRMASWEHIINDAAIINAENIVLCCVACNSSKGAKKLSDWLSSGYCKKRSITSDSVAEIVKHAIPRP